MKNILNKFLIGILLIVPSLVNAQVTLVPGDDLAICDIFGVMENLFTLLLLTTSGAVALTIVIGGAQMIISGGNPSGMNDGVKMVQNGITGLIMVAASIIILNTLLIMFGVGGSFGALVSISSSGFDIECGQSGAIAPGDGGGTVDTGLLVMPRTGGGTNPTGGGIDPGRGDLPPTGPTGVADMAVTGYSPELRAFMRALTYAEGVSDSQGYYRGFGGTMFNGVLVHPGITNPNLHNENRDQFGYNSDAFGRYQMLSGTWEEWAAAANIPRTPSGEYNISPQYQDAAVAAFLQRRGIEGMLQNGNVSGAASNLGGTWTSLPGGSQPNPRTSEFYALYDRLLAEERAR